MYKKSNDKTEKNTCNSEFHLVNPQAISYSTRLYTVKFN